MNHFGSICLIIILNRVTLSLWHIQMMANIKSPLHPKSGDKHFGNLKYTHGSAKHVENWFSYCNHTTSTYLDHTKDHDNVNRRNYRSYKPDHVLCLTLSVSSKFADIVYIPAVISQLFLPVSRYSLKNIIWIASLSIIYSIISCNHNHLESLISCNHNHLESLISCNHNSWLKLSAIHVATILLC